MNSEGIANGAVSFQNKSKVQPITIKETHVIFVDSIKKERDQQGNSVIEGGAGAQYKITSKKSLLASGSLCKIKLCRNIGEPFESDTK